MQLTAENVYNTVMDCLYPEGTNIDDVRNEMVTVPAIRATFCFSPKGLERNKANIDSMLSQLPKDFMKSSGGGMSFLQACFNSNGMQWGEQHNAEDLMVLGMGIGLVKFCMPREMWGMFPGGVPYFVVDDGLLTK